MQTNSSANIKMIDLLITGRCLPLIYVVAKLGVPDLLKEGEKPIAELAKLAAANEDALYRVLRALCPLDIFRECRPRVFSIGELGQSLQTDFPKSAKNVALMVGSPYFWRPWGELLSAVKEGASPFERCFGESFFSYLSKNTEASELFNGAMTSSSEQTNEVVASQYDFSSVKKVLDIGGGEGALARAILKKHPTLDIQVLDISQAVSIENQSTKIKFLSGDFFKAIPAGFDAYLLQKIIHDWNDEAAIQILKNCRKSIGESGKVLIVESVIREGENDLGVLQKDVEMLIMTAGGRERTESEFASILTRSGFRLNRIIDTGTSLSILEAEPI